MLGQAQLLTRRFWNILASESKAEAAAMADGAAKRGGRSAGGDTVNGDVAAAADGVRLRRGFGLRKTAARMPHDHERADEKGYSVLSLFNGSSECLPCDLIRMWL